MELGIKNKIALVTGGGRGIGAAVCESLAKEGATIIAVARTLADLENLDKKLGVLKENKFFVFDLEKQEDVGKLVRELHDQGLSPDIIVNNVGGNLNFTDPLGGLNEWRQVMYLNVEVAIQINHAFLPHMRERKWGRICHVSSISALENQGPPAYCAAKAALNAYIRSLGRFVSSDNVILTSVMPGAVLTKDGYWDIATKERPEHVKKYLSERMAIKRFGHPMEVADLITVMCSEISSFCVGSNLLADGGQGRVFYSQDNDI